jgi:hypothetical protein
MEYCDNGQGQMNPNKQRHNQPGKKPGPDPLFPRTYGQILFAADY